MFVNWPMLHEAQVVGVSDAMAEYSIKKHARNFLPDGGHGYMAFGNVRKSGQFASHSCHADNSRADGGSLSYKSKKAAGLQHHRDSKANTIYATTISSSEAEQLESGINDGISDVAVVKRSFSKTEAQQWRYEAIDLHDEYLKGRGIPGHGGIDIGYANVKFVSVIASCDFANVQEI